MVVLSRPRSRRVPTSATYLAYANTYGATSNSIPLTVGWSRDDRDSALAPNSGRYQRLNSGGLWRVMRAMCGATTSTSQYIPLNKRFTVAFNGNWAAARG